MRVPPDVERKCLELAGVKPAAGTALYAELPLPPSVNNLFVTRGNRRFKSPEYRAWLADAVPKLRALKPPATLPAAITVTVLGALNTARDLDNLLKPVGDALVAAGVLPGDSVKHVRKWAVEWKPGAGGEPVARVEVGPMEGT